jgi:hypothetical protein
MLGAMGIFKRSSPEDALEALRLRAAKLESRRAAAQVSLDEAKTRRQAHLLEGDLDGDDRQIEKLERDVVAASTRLGGLVDAISALNTQISEQEYQIQVERDAGERKVAAERLTDQVEKFEAALTPILTAMRTFYSVCEPIGVLSFEAKQMCEYIGRIASEVEIAAAFVGPDLRAQIGMVASGERQAPRQPAEVIELRPIEPMPSPTDAGEEVQEWFGVKPMKWKGSDGRVHQTNRFEDVSLPTRLVARASRGHCAVE